MSPHAEAAEGLLGQRVTVTYAYGYQRSGRLVAIGERVTIDNGEESLSIERADVEDIREAE